MQNVLKITVSIILMLIISCIDNNKSVKLCIDKVEELLSKTERTAIKKLQKDTLIHFIMFELSEETREKARNSYLEINEQLINDGINEYRLIVILCAVHYKLNNEKINLKKIFKEVKIYCDNVNSKINSSEEEYFQKKMEISAFNFNKFKIGDTLCLIFPVKDIERFTTAVLYDKYKEGEVFDKSLLVEGVLLYKDTLYHANPPRFDNQTSLGFSIKITNLSDTTPLILLVKYKEGDKLNLLLNEYGRPISRYCNSNND